jgi:hypothetical protein
MQLQEPSQEFFAREEALNYKLFERGLSIKL